MLKASSFILASLLYPSILLATSIETPNIPSVKYPAAVVFEGVRGEIRLNENDTMTQKPVWRLFICLGHASTPVSGRVVLDLAKLGTPVDFAMPSSTTDEIIVVERLNKVVLDYQYQTAVTVLSSSDNQSAITKVDFKSHSTQTWELTELAPRGYQHNAYTDATIFNTKIDKETFAHLAYSSHKSNGESFYISSSLNRFHHDEDSGASNVIAVCEQASSPYVLQTGSDLTSP